MEVLIQGFLDGFEVSRLRQSPAEGIGCSHLGLAASGQLELGLTTSRQLRNQDPHPQHDAKGQKILGLVNPKRVARRDEEEIQAHDPQPRGHHRRPAPPARSGHDDHEQVEHHQTVRMKVGLDSLTRCRDSGHHGRHLQQVPGQRTALPVCHAIQFLSSREAPPADSEFELVADLEDPRGRQAEEVGRIPRIPG